MHLKCLRFQYAVSINLKKTYATFSITGMITCCIFCVCGLEPDFGPVPEESMCSSDYFNEELFLVYFTVLKTFSPWS